MTLRLLVSVLLSLATTLAGPATSASATDWRTDVLVRGVLGDFAALRDATTATTSAPDGSVQVFASPSADGAVRHLALRGGRWRATSTPYAGSVLAAASDATGTSVLLLDGTGTFSVGTRTTAGRFGLAVPVLRERGRVFHGAAAMLATGGTWQVFLSYTAADGPDSPGRSSGLVTASSAAPTQVRVLRTSAALTLTAAWLPGRVAALVLADEASRQVLFGRGAAGRWAFGPLARGFGAPVDAAGRDGRLSVAWIDGRDVLSRETDGRAWGPVSRVAVLPGNAGAVQVELARGRTWVGWSSLRARLDAPVRDAVLHLSERTGGGAWRTTQVTRAGAPELVALGVGAGRPVLVHRLAAVVPGEVRATRRG